MHHATARACHDVVPAAALGCPHPMGIYFVPSRPFFARGQEKLGGSGPPPLQLGRTGQPAQLAAEVRRPSVPLHALEQVL